MSKAKAGSQDALVRLSAVCVRCGQRTMIPAAFRDLLWTCARRTQRGECGGQIRAVNAPNAPRSATEAGQ